MFELIFGLLFTIISTIILIVFLASGESNIIVLLVCGLFLIIGLIFMIKGLIKIIKDILTSKKGEECYGCVKDIQETGEYVNGAPIYKAEFNVYVESEYRTFELSEKIGMKPEKYPIGSYAKLKYYDNDINIIESIEETSIPEEIKEKIKVDKMIDEIIEIDGIKYKRMY